jgi:hypothetical protein
MSQGTQIRIAAWPGMSSSRHLFLSKAFASQVAAHVIDVGEILSPDHVSETYADAAESTPGENCIISPTGKVAAGPAEGGCILMADCSVEDIFRASQAATSPGTILGRISFSCMSTGPRVVGR